MIHAGEPMPDRMRRLNLAAADRQPHNWLKMNHVDFLRGLDPSARSRLSAPDSGAGLRRLVAHLALILACATPVVLRLPLWQVAVLPLGITLVFLFAPEHECTHATPFRPVWLNTVVGTAAGLLLVLPFLSFRYFHLAHHRHTNDPDRDPELAGPPLPTTRAGWALRISGLPYWAGQIRALVDTAAGRALPAWVPPGAAARVRFEARAYLVVYLVAAGSLAASPLVLRLWVVPVLLGQPFLRLYLLAEHGDCPRVADMFANTRTTLTNRAVRFLAWNMPYHAEHHAFPAAPFHNLPDLHALARAHLRQTAGGYIGFSRDYLARHARPAPPAG